VIVLDAVRRWPGLASIELANRLSLDRYQVARRLPELESAGLVSKGEPHQTGKRRGVSWWPIEVDVSKGE
jgi:DNA-binding MarR family transcriptional regulator